MRRFAWWKYRNEVLNTIAGAVEKDPRPSAVFGDFNMAPWTPHFKKLITGRLKDTMEGKGLQLTWHTEFPSIAQIPLDHVLMTEEWENQERRVLEDIGSDHYPLYVEMFLK